MEAMSQQHTLTPLPKMHLDQFGHIYASFDPEKAEIGVPYEERHLFTLAPTSLPGEGQAIVTACNSHAALVEALKRTKVLLEALNGSPGFAHLEHEIPAIRAALKLVEGA